MPDMIALKEVYYDGRTVLKGERFSILPQHVRLYQILKRAEPAPAAEPEPAAKPVRRRAMLPADPEPTASTEDPALAAGRYARRDMRPTDDET